MSKWAEIQPHFEIDGLARDILVQNTNADDWNRFLSWIRSLGSATFTTDGQQKPIPKNVDEVLSIRGLNSPVLEISLPRNIKLHCYFFLTQESADPLLLDVETSEIQSVESFAELWRFVLSLSQQLGKEVAITHESRPDAIIARCAPR